MRSAGNNQEPLSQKDDLYMTMFFKCNTKMIFTQHSRKVSYDSSLMKWPPDYPDFNPETSILSLKEIYMRMEKEIRAMEILRMQRKLLQVMLKSKE